MLHPPFKPALFVILIALWVCPASVYAVETFKVSSYGGAHQIWFEAEDFDERDPADDSSFAVVDEPDAFGQAISSLSGTDGASMIRYTFDISKAGGKGGTWYFWGRVINPSNQSDFMLIEGHPGDPFPIELPVSGLTNAQRAFEGNAGPPWTWFSDNFNEAHTKTLRDGENNMVFLARQSGALWDVLMWTDSPDYVPTDEDYENATAPARGIATGPSPGSEAIDVLRDMGLSWNAGEFAVSHNVYLGTGFEDVNNASVADPLGVLVSEGQDANSYDPDGLLAFGQTYYWRVDEVNGPPDRTVIPGEVWSFTAEPFSIPIEMVTVTASGSSSADTGPEKTVDGSGLDGLDQHSTIGSDMWLSNPGGPAWIQYEFAGLHKLHEMWVWNSNQMIENFVGLGAKDVTIETSQDGEVWTVLEDVSEFAQAPGRSTYTANTIVDFAGAMAKFVRITINAGYGMLPQYGLSEVRFFSIPTNARAPQPAAGATVDGVNIDLKWRAGREAASHEVSLGTDPNNLTLLGSSSEPSLTSGPLDYSTTYFWRVDEVNQAETPTAYVGDIWSFTTPDYGTVDSFDQYDDKCNRIFFAWEDGLGHSGGADIDDCDMPASNGNGGGSIVGNEQAPFAERTIVNGGSSQSMPFNYDNAFGPSEATLRIDGQDWSASGIQTLALAFYGTADNTGQLYVKINNSKVMYDLDPADIAQEGWQAWNVDLTGLGGLQNVTSLTIGVDGANAAGMLYIDDIRLYPVPGELITPTEPDPANLLTYYSFDEGAGTVAGDTSGNGHDGVLVGPPQWVAGKVGGALSFGNGSHVLDDDGHTYVNGLTAITVTLWIKSNVVGTDAGFIIFDTPSGNDQRGIRYDEDGGEGDVNLLKYGMTYTSGNEEDESPANLQTTEWQHVAVTSASGEGLSLYLDGLRVLPEEDDVSESGVITGCTTLIVGKGGKDQVNSAGWDGLIDEVRIYGRVLSAGEVMWLAGRAQPVHKPLQ